ADTRGKLAAPFFLGTVDGGGQVGLVDAEITGRIVERQADLARLRRKWAIFSAEALSRRDSIDLMKKAISERWSTS
ncbi:MAG TPA: Scr1 family TA system antitoxin-like transcriptional regulator, partial [Streptosporangiaceae bacterium]